MNEIALVLAFGIPVLFVLLLLAGANLRTHRKGGPPAYDNVGMPTDWDHPEFSYEGHQAKRFGAFAFIVVLVIAIGIGILLAPPL